MEAGGVFAGFKHDTGSPMRRAGIKSDEFDSNANLSGLELAPSAEVEIGGTDSFFNISIIIIVCK